MKKPILSILNVLTFVLVLVLAVSCGGNKGDGHDHEGEGTEMAEAQYACPMHPEETGVKGDKCGKCGMDLEEVTE